MKKTLLIALVLTLVPLFSALAESPVVVVDPAVEVPADKTGALRPNNPIVGSWFGRAVPVENPPCPPGSDGCLVPTEITMVLTFFADGTFVGIDSQTFGDGSHTTAHGQWERTGRGQLKAEFVFLQEGVNDTFIGAFRMRMVAENIDRGQAEGFINAHFFPFTDDNGQVIVDDQGNPIPDPLTELGPLVFSWPECLPENLCFGVFEFKIRRISPE